MSQVDRRTLIGVAGASVALAACGEMAKKDDGATRQTGAADSPCPTTKGVNEQWGEDPHGPAPATPPSGGFAPLYICIVYIKLDNGKKTLVRHGYQQIRLINQGEAVSAYEAYQVAEAEKILKAAANGPWKNNGSIGHSRKEVNFENFNFGQQMRIFAVIDDDNITFDNRLSANKHANLVRFTQYRTSKRMDVFEPECADQNHAFFGATLVDVNITGQTRKALRLDNWYVGPNGAKIIEGDPTTHQRYAINFQLLWTADKTEGGLGLIPFVIDPDGGNMGNAP